jgi:hypothetical protein
MKLVDALAQFNRKERYWLIRNALGDSSRTLDKGFRATLSDVNGIEVPEDAWWAMDYHLDWLVGALDLYKSGGKNGGVQPNAADLVQGNQEDIDLVIAFDQTLILIEAKGDSPWNNEQLDSKLCRLEACFKYVDPVKAELSVFFLLMSPTKSEKLKRKDQRTWPNWMVHENGQPRWSKLRMAEAGQEPKFLRVVRYSEAAGAVDKAGLHWKVQ